MSSSRANFELLSASRDDSKIWHFQSGKESFLSQIHPKKKPINAARWNHNHTLIATGSEDGSVYMSEASGHIIHEFNQSHAVRSLAFSGRSEFLCVGGKGGECKVWDLKTRQASDFRGHEGDVTSVVFGRADMLIASGGSDGRIMTHNVVHNTPTIVAVNGPASMPHTITCLGFSVRQKGYLAAASDDGRLRLWDTNKSSDSNLLGDFHAHDAPATCVSFSKKFRRMYLSTGLDGKMVFYDVTKGRVIESYKCGEAMTCAQFHGENIFAGTQTGKILVYDMRKFRGYEDTIVPPVCSFQAHSSSIHSLLCDAWEKSDSKLRNRKPNRSMSIGQSFTKNALKARNPNATYTAGRHLSDETLDTITSPVASVSGANPTTNESKDDVWAKSNVRPDLDISLYSNPKFLHKIDASFDLLSADGGRQSIGSYRSHRSRESGTLRDLKAGRPPLSPSSDPVARSPKEAWASSQKSSPNHSGGTSPTSNPPSRYPQPDRTRVSQSTIPEGVPPVGDKALNFAHPRTQSTNSLSTSKSHPTTPFKRPEAKVLRSSDRLETVFRPSETMLSTRQTNAMNGVRNGPQPDARKFQMDLLRSTIKEVVEASEERLREEISALHVEMIRQFHIQHQFLTNALGAQTKCLKDMAAELKALREDDY